METTIEGLNATIEQEYRPIMSYCRGQFENQEEAQDIAHNAIMAALAFVRKNPSFKADNWKHWLWKIVRCTITDQYRWNGRRKGKYLSLEECTEMGQDAGTTLDSANADTGAAGTVNHDITMQLSVQVDYVSSIHNKNMVELVNRVVTTRLTDQQRTPFVMHYYQEYNRHEISQMLYPNDDPKRAYFRTHQLVVRGTEALREMFRTPAYAAQLAG